MFGFEDKEVLEEELEEEYDVVDEAEDEPEVEDEAVEDAAVDVPSLEAKPVVYTRLPNGALKQL